MPSVMDTREVVAAPEDLRLELTRVIKAPRARVFDAWARPEMIRLWFGAQGRTTAAVETDPQVGGAYLIAMESCEGKGGSKATGRYLQVNPYDLLQFTWENNWTPGEESLVTIHFRDMDGGTEIKLIHDRFQTKESRDGHSKGWNGILDHLVEVLEA